MERLTGKGAKSLKEAYAKVYSEQAKTTKDGARYTDLPGGGSRKEFQTAVKGGMRVKWVIDKNGKGSWIPDQPEFKPNLQYVGATGAETKRIDPTKDDSGRPLSTSSNNNPPSSSSSSRPNYTEADARRDQERAKEQAQRERTGNTTPVSTSTDTPPAPQKSARQQELDAINADKNLTPMQKWEKANPKLAAAKRERDRVRGTAQSDNPMLGKGMRSKMPVNSPSIQSSEVSKLGSGSQRLRDNPNALRGASSTTGSSTAASSTPAVQPKVQPAAQPKVQPAANPNQQASLNNTVRSGTGGSPAQPQRLPVIPYNQSNMQSRVQALQSRRQAVANQNVPTGSTVKTAVNPDSSLRVTQRRSPEATARIKKSLELSSVDLFDIIQGEFIEEGYTQEDTIYMMANLNEEQLQEFMKYVQGAINVGKRIPGVRGVINRVGAMFNRAPKQVPSGQVGALRLYQDKANQSLNRLNQQTTRLNNRAATRATQRETDRLNNLDPRAVGERNAREAGAQIRARNERLGRPVDAAPQPVDKLNYKPGDPMFDDYVKRHHANQRGGVNK